MLKCTTQIFRLRFSEGEFRFNFRYMPASLSSGMGFDPAFYMYRPVSCAAAHGYGPVIWAGAEMIRLIKLQHPKMNDSAVQFYPAEVKTNEPIFNYDGEIKY